MDADPSSTPARRMGGALAPARSAGDSRWLVGAMRRCDATTLLAVHAGLGQRWACLPLATLWLTGSVSVAYTFTGQFAVWAVLVLVADSGAGLVVAGRLTRTSSRRAIQAGTAGVALSATFVAWCVPIVGLAAALGTGACIVAAFALAARKDEPRYIYYAWGLLESLLGVLAAYTLYYTRTLSANKMDVTLPSWRWLVLLYGVNCALGIASVVLQAMVFLMVSRVPAANIVTRERAPASVELWPMRLERTDRYAPVPCSVDSRLRVERQELASIDNCLTCGKLLTVAWSGILLFLALGWMATQLFPPGERWPESPACSLQCFCQPLNLSLLNVSQQQDANINIGCASRRLVSSTWAVSLTFACNTGSRRCQTCRSATLFSDGKIFG